MTNMSKLRVTIITICLLTGLFGYALAKYQTKRTHNPYSLQEGDVVFQETKSNQATAVKAATNSRWSHVGIIVRNNGKLAVLEAVHPVRITSLKRFISRSPSSFYAMRLKNAEEKLTPEAIKKAGTYGKSLIGKNYDSRFQWSDDRIYCSELVWKVYKHATGVELCKPRAFKTYNLEHPTVKRLIKQRYGSFNKLHLDELAVAPSDLAESPLLIEVPKK